MEHPGLCYIYVAMIMISKGTWAILGAAVVLVRGGIAIDVTCSSCSDTCCQWAFAAHLATVNGAPSIETYGREAFERHGFDPIPCRDVLGDEQAYYRCAEKAFFRCRDQKCCKFKAKPKGPLGGLLKPDKPFGDVRFYESLSEQLDKLWFNDEWQKHSSRGVSGAEPVRLHPGQVIVLEKVNGTWEETHD